MQTEQPDDSDEDLYQLAKHGAIDLLSRREHSAQEIRDKLSRRKQLKYFDFDALIDELVEAGWLSHERFAENFIRARRNRGQGPVKIKHDLRHRGLRDDEFEELLSCYDDWHDHASEVLSRRYSQPPVDQKQRAKMQRFLQSRGFSFDSIQTAISRLKEIDDLSQ